MRYPKINPSHFAECKPLASHDRFIVTCKHVVDQHKPVLIVVRSKDFHGKPLYQYLCSPEVVHVAVDEGMFVCPDCMVKMVSTPTPVPELDVGQHAVRDDATAPWVVGRFQDKEELS